MISGLRMPGEILHALKDRNPAAMGSAASQLSGRIFCITEFSSQLATLALSPKLDTPLFLEQGHALARRFAKIVPEAGKLIAGSLEYALEQLNSLAKHGNFISPVVVSRLRSHAKMGAQPQGSTASTEATPNVATTPATVTTAQAGPSSGNEVAVPPTETPTLSPADALWETPPVEPPADEAEPSEERRPASGQAMDWAEQLAGSIAFESQAEALPADASSLIPEDPWVSVLATIQQVMQADHCAIFLGRKGGKRTSLHRWTGGFGQAGVATPVCTTTERTVFGVCLMRNETVLIHDGLDASLDNYLPAWMGLACPRPGAFLLLALSTEQPADGFVYLTWAKPRKIIISAAQTSLIRSLIAPHLSEFALVESR